MNNSTATSQGQQQQQQHTITAVESIGGSVNSRAPPPPPPRTNVGVWCYRSNWALYLMYFFAFWIVGGGIALMALGAVRLNRHGAREDLVRDYNAAISGYQPYLGGGYETIPSWYVVAGVFNDTSTSSTSGSSSHQQESFLNSSSKYPMRQTSHVVAPEGDDGAADVLKKRSYFASAAVEVPELQFSQNRGDEITIQINGGEVSGAATGSAASTFLGTNSHRLSYPLFKEFSEDIECEPEWCDLDCNKYGSSECSKAGLLRHCQHLYGNTASLEEMEDDSCHEYDGTCGICTYHMRLDSICLVAETDWYGELKLDSTGAQYRSCYFPFSADIQRYSATPAHVEGIPYTLPVVIRSSSDPFMVLQSYTQGSMTFGSSISLLAQGVMFSVLGLSMIMASLIGCIVYRCCLHQKRFCCLGSPTDGLPEEVADQQRHTEGGDDDVGAMSSVGSGYYSNGAGNRSPIPGQPIAYRYNPREEELAAIGLNPVKVVAVEVYPVGGGR